MNGHRELSSGLINQQQTYGGRGGGERGREAGFVASWPSAISGRGGGEGLTASASWHPARRRKYLTAPVL